MTISSPILSDLIAELINEDPDVRITAIRQIPFWHRDQLLELNLTLHGILVRPEQTRLVTLDTLIATGSLRLEMHMFVYEKCANNWLKMVVFLANLKYTCS